MSRVALLTCQKFPSLYEDDQLLTAELARRGHTPQPLDWRKASVAALDGFEVVVVRNPWDWFDHREAFRDFLASLETVRARVVNAPSTMRAFADKTYLPKLAARGVSVVPTVELTPEALPTQLPALLAEHAWQRAVIKPAFTANAVGAQVFATTDVSQVLARATQVPLAKGELWLVQPFIESIAEGERSYVFFGGRFSHAVKKTPRAGDWRVQHDYGGVAEAFTPAAPEVAEAQRILELAAPGTTYARVDAVEWQGRLHLMELEVVEPELFFRLHAPAAAAMVDAIFPS